MDHLSTLWTRRERANGEISYSSNNLTQDCVAVSLTILQ